VSTRANRRPVYSTAAGRLCPTCGWPLAECHCSRRLDQAVPSKIVARLRVERAGRGGKTVTVVDGLPRNRGFLAALLGELKRACGSGGALRDDAVELQGDHRDRLRERLAARGWEVRG